MKRAIWLGIVLLLVLGAAYAAAHSNAQTVAKTSLNNGPYTDAQTLSSVPRNTGVTILERKGGWYHVRLASGKQGWVPMTSLRFDHGAGNKAGGGWSASTYALFESGRSGATGTTATTGVRGLNQGTIQNAVPDPQAVDALSKYAVSADTARKFASQLKHKSEKIAYLPKGGK